MTRRVQILVSGRVQGVGYRASAVDAADGFDLSGWVANLADGRVKLEAQGTAEQVSAFIQWCRRGPLFARVDEVSVIDLEPRDCQPGFRVRHAPF